MTTRAWKRQGLPTATQNMLTILQVLHQAHQADYPWQELNADSRTIKALVVRDWIMDDEGLDGTRYAITGRGRHALQVYEAPDRRRYDGICPDCGQRPKHGNLGYCLQCHNQRSKQTQRRNGGPQRKPDSICPRCGQRTLYVASTGRVYPYCLECKREMHRAYKHRQTKKLLKRLNRGEVILCIRCSKRNRYFTENTVYDYCHECYRQQQHEAAIRRAYRRHFADQHQSHTSKTIRKVSHEPTS